MKSSKVVFSVSLFLPGREGRSRRVVVLSLRRRSAVQVFFVGLSCPWVRVSVGTQTAVMQTPSPAMHAPEHHGLRSSGHLVWCWHRMSPLDLGATALRETRALAVLLPFCRLLVGC